MANIRTFKNLQDETLAWLDEVGATNISLTLVKQAIRAAHEKRISDERWGFMLSSPTTFSTVVGQQTYTLDEGVQRLMYVKNLTTGDPLVEYTAQNAQAGGLFVTPTDIDTANRFALWGRSEVQAQPSVPTEMAVVSSNSGDNDLSMVTVTGTTATGIQSEVITCFGTPTIVFSEILKVSKASGWAGAMTLQNFAGTEQYLTLQATEYGKLFPKFYLLSSPSEVDSIEYRFYRQPSALSANGDRPDIPPPFEEILVWDALLDMSVYNEFNPLSVQYWRSKRDALELTLLHTHGMAHTINQAMVSTTYIPR